MHYGGKKLIISQSMKEMENFIQVSLRVIISETIPQRALRPVPMRPGESQYICDFDEGIQAIKHTFWRCLLPFERDILDNDFSAILNMGQCKKLSS